MKRLSTYGILVLATLVLISCKKEEPVVSNNNSVSNPNAPNKIMALGASRVEGDTPSFESYRY